LRVPLIISGANLPTAQKQSAFSFVTDITPTILALANIPEKSLSVPMTGKSLVPAIQKDTALVYQPDEAIGIEAAGHSALFKGNMKLTIQEKPMI